MLVICVTGDLQALEIVCAAEADSSNKAVLVVQWDTKDRWGNTPFDHAKHGGHTAMVEFIKARMASGIGH